MIQMTQNCSTIAVQFPSRRDTTHGFMDPFRPDSAQPYPRLPILITVPGVSSPSILYIFTMLSSGINFAEEYWHWLRLIYSKLWSTWGLMQTWVSNWGRLGEHRTGTDKSGPGGSVSQGMFSQGNIGKQEMGGVCMENCRSWRGEEQGEKQSAKLGY